MTRHELCLASAADQGTMTRHQLCEMPARGSSQELPCAARATGPPQGAPAAASDLGQGTAGSRTKIKPSPWEEKARWVRAMGCAGAQHRPLPRRAHPPSGERKKSLRRAGPGRGRAKESSGSTTKLLAVAAVHRSSTTNSKARRCGSKGGRARLRLGQ